jgi:hypothetical protein
MEKVILKNVTDYIKYTQIVSNLARQKMLVLTICSMLKSRSVVLGELAYHLNDSVKTSSNETRLRDFFREVDFDYYELAKFIVCFLLSEPCHKIRLSIDRTNWEFGTHSINILMVTASRNNHNVPLFWDLLDNKGGNSNTTQRIDILQKCIDLLGESKIGLLVGDREFIGEKWLNFLKKKHIPFCVRVPKSHKIEDMEGNIYLAEELWQRRKKPISFKYCIVDGVKGSAYISVDAKNNLLFLFGTVNVVYLEQMYKKRWTIETIFHSFKSRGFNLEDTHIQINERIEKLIGVVSIAYAFCCSLGIFIDKNDKKIKLKNHKRKTNSFFRYGLNFFREGFKVGYKYKQQWIDLFTNFCKAVFPNTSLSVT